MKSIGYTGGKSLAQAGAFESIEEETPAPSGRDMLVRIRAISVNPVDTKIRQNLSDLQNPPRVLGWDAAGIVEAIGDKVTLFCPGDAVYYAGDINRSGSNASHQLVDERIVGRKPESVDFAQAAALPLTSITAWEALFERLKINPNEATGKSILIIGAAGGVGSIAIQLAKRIAKLNVIATASRDASRQWCIELGADFVINHYDDIVESFSQLSLPQPDYILCLNDTDRYFQAMTYLVAPQGMICAVVDTHENHDLSVLKAKSAGFVWEFMFTRSMYQTKDMIQQHNLLNTVATLVDEKVIRTTLRTPADVMTPESLAKVHQMIETGNSIGKLVLTIQD